MKGMGATGTSRGTGRVTRTGVEFGLDVGIGQLGISTDYGGGIVIGIGGQKIVWGREGGKIYYNVGGFEVIVEARNCVVVETRKIAGQVVGIHTYPDPGCKLPEDPKPEPDHPLPPSSNNPNNIATVRQCLGGDYELLCSEIPPGSGGGKERIYRLLDALAVNDEYFNSFYDSATDEKEANKKIGVNKWEKTTINQNYTVYFGPRWIYLSSQNKNYVGSEGVIAGGDASTKRTQNRDIYLQKGGGSIAFSSVAYNIRTVIISATSPPPCPIPLPKPQLFPPAGNQPPMPDRCCEALQADIEDIKTVLAVESFLKKKVEIPGELLEIQTDGKSVPKPETILNYAQMAHAVLLTINRYGIDAPIKVEIEDTDTTKKGKQSDEFTYNSGAVALQAILELLWEIKGDSASRLKLQVRIAYAVTRILKIVAGVGESVRTLLKMLGLPLRYDKKKLILEFNLAAAKRGKGFGNTTKGTTSTEAEVETLLPGLLEETEYEVPVPVFDAKDEDIRELLVKIHIALQSLPRK
jgi:hypothetical protein